MIASAFRRAWEIYERALARVKGQSLTPVTDRSENLFTSLLSPVQLLLLGLIIGWPSSMAGQSTATLTCSPPSATNQVTLTWNAPGSSVVQLYLGSPSGTLFAEVGPAGSTQTGDWAVVGMLFSLVDGTTGALLASATVPSPLTIMPAGPNQVTLNWDAPGSSGVQLYVGSPEGTLFAEGGPTGSAKTGNWAVTGMVFYLVDSVTGQTLAFATVPPPSGTLTITTIGVNQVPLSWSAPESYGAQLWVDSPTGTLFAAGGPTSTAQTGAWAPVGLVSIWSIARRARHWLPPRFSRSPR